MRTVTYGAACSLDGFIAGSNGEIDWLQFGPDVQDIMRDYWKSVDAILMGRKTWDQAVRMSGGKMGGTSTIKTYIFSRTLTSLDAKGAELVRGDAGAFVHDLKNRSGKAICLMGGGDFARSLFEANVVDEVGMNVHPVLLGAGVPMFLDPCHRVGLELITSRTIEGGCVYSMYRVKH